MTTKDKIRIIGGKLMLPQLIELKAQIERK
jgi:hypothetical protein